MYRCLLCNTHNQLQMYESLLYNSISNKQGNIVNHITEEDDETMNECTKDGECLKSSQKEFLLRGQFGYLITLIDFS